MTSNASPSSIISSVRAYLLVAVTICVSSLSSAALPSDKVDDTKINQRDADSQTLTPLDQSNSKVDTEIVAKIRSALTEDKSLSVNAQNVKVIVQGGNVTLRGPVANSNEKIRVQEIAKGIAGVNKITNEIDVKH